MIEHVLQPLTNTYIEWRVSHRSEAPSVKEDNALAFDVETLRLHGVSISCLFSDPTYFSQRSAHYDGSLARQQPRLRCVLSSARASCPRPSALLKWRWTSRRLSCITSCVASAHDWASSCSRGPLQNSPASITVVNGAASSPTLLTSTLPSSGKSTGGFPCTSATCDWMAHEKLVPLLFL